jgi:hypothetical protein
METKKLYFVLDGYAERHHSAQEWTDLRATFETLEEAQTYIKKRLDRESKNPSKTAKYIAYIFEGANTEEALETDPVDYFEEN